MGPGPGPYSYVSADGERRGGGGATAYGPMGGAPYGCMGSGAGRGAGRLTVGAVGGTALSAGSNSRRWDSVVSTQFAMRVCVAR